MNHIDYPAAHSMDAEWFAIDEAGEVAYLQAGENGPIPEDGIPGLGFFDMLEHLDKDEYGTPLLPTPGDFFPQGHSTAVLDQLLAERSANERLALEQLAAEKILKPNKKRRLEEAVSREYLKAIVLLADAADAQGIEKAWYVIRLDPTIALYGVNGFPLVEALRLHLQGRVLAWRDFKEDGRHFDLGLPAVLGVYVFSVGNNDFEERVNAANESISLPPRYERNSMPEHPRIGMPEVSRPEGGKFVHALPGVRFAEASDFQLADQLDYWDWGKGFQPKTGDGD